MNESKKLDHLIFFFFNFTHKGRKYLRDIKARFNIYFFNWWRRLFLFNLIAKTIQKYFAVCISSVWMEIILKWMSLNKVTYSYTQYAHRFFHLGVHVPFYIHFWGCNVPSNSLHLGVQRKLTAFSPHKVVHHAVFCKY